uniref:Uncharacterized protein n=1 Tax=Anopheles funestus TaxID=62324 RepID=A0A182S210_ANOFN
MLHALERVQIGTELFALKQVRDGCIQATLCQSNHLRPNTDATFVQESGRILVTLAELAKNVLLRDAHIVQMERARSGRADTELAFPLAYGESFVIAFHDEGRNATISSRRVSVCHDQEHTGQIRVGDPHFRTVQYVVITVLLGGGFQRERIGSGGRFRQRKAATEFLAQLRQVLALLFRRTELDHERVNERVVDVNEGSRCRAHLGQFLHHQHGRHEVARTATILVAHLDTHQPVVEQGAHNGRIELVFLVHLLHQRCNLFLCHLGHRFLHHQLILAQIGKGRCGTAGRTERRAGERARTDRAHRSDHLAKNVLQHLWAVKGTTHW